MSETPNGSDWWLGTDGKWYPPVAAAHAQPEPDTVHDAALAPTEPAADGESSEPQLSRRGWPLVAAAIVVAVVVATIAVLALGGGSNEEDRYLEALDERELHEWATDRAAINAGYTVCEGLDTGGPTRGSETDQVAVTHFCPDYLDAFRVLETATVEGTFTVVDARNFDGASGDICRPDGGYGDINSSTQAIVRNPAGDELARTSLGPGEFTSRSRCRFTFEFTVTEGESVYILGVGRQGEIDYAREQISRTGSVALVLGD